MPRRNWPPRKIALLKPLENRSIDSAGATDACHDLDLWIFARKEPGQVSDSFRPWIRSLSTLVMSFTCRSRPPTPTFMSNSRNRPDGNSPTPIRKPRPRKAMSPRVARAFMTAAYGKESSATCRSVSRPCAGFCGSKVYIKPAPLISRANASRCATSVKSGLPTSCTDPISARAVASDEPSSLMVIQIDCIAIMALRWRLSN